MNIILHYQILKQFLSKNFEGNNYSIAHIHPYLNVNELVSKPRETKKINRRLGQVYVQITLELYYNIQKFRFLEEFYCYILNVFSYFGGKIRNFP